MFFFDFFPRGTGVGLLNSFRSSSSRLALGWWHDNRWLVTTNNHGSLKFSILLMEEIPRSPVEVGSLSHYLQGFIHPRWCRILSINSSSPEHQPLAKGEYLKFLNLCFMLNFWAFHKRNVVNNDGHLQTFNDKFISSKSFECAKKIIPCW